MLRASGSNDDLPLRCRIDTGPIIPLKQGELDGLCGLYAVINGIRLALADRRPLDQREVRRLYSRGIAFLAGHSALTVAMLGGFAPELWPELLAVILAELHRRTGLLVRSNRLLRSAATPTDNEVSTLIESAVCQGYPVLVELDGWYEHYTVIAGYTPTIFRLFDSGNLHWLVRGACGTDDGSSRRHVIDPRSLIVLALA